MFRCPRWVTALRRSRLAAGSTTRFSWLRSVPRVEVRVPGQSALFNVSGSDSVVAECLQRQDEAIRNPTPRFPNTSPEDE